MAGYFGRGRPITGINTYTKTQSDDRFRDSISGDMLPDSDDTRDLGSSSKAWAEVHVENLYAENTKWEKIGESTPSSVASVEYTSSFDGSSLSEFRTLRLTFVVKPVTDSVFFTFNTSTDGGSTYDSGTNNYFSGFNTSLVGTGQQFYSSPPLTTNIGNAANEEGSGIVHIFNFNQSSRCHYVSSFFAESPAGSYDAGISTGSRLDSTARDAILFKMTSGNIQSGYFLLEGVRG